MDPLKLDFNRIREEAREDLLRGTRQSHLVEAFYTGTLRAVEHDEVAQGFRVYYEQVRRDFPDPEDVLWQLEMYVLATAGCRHAHSARPGSFSRASSNGATSSTHSLREGPGRWGSRHDHPDEGHRSRPVPAGPWERRSSCSSTSSARSARPRPG
ncbi:hypothetical protein [Streptomyces tendae]|uniref:hypothetical protein n=1 Tax=Streptomyces tendae TaxID=1932 RepID=UPI0036C03282